MNTNSVGFKISTGMLALLMFVFLSGVVPIAAVIIYKKSTKFNTATVQVQAEANALYNTALV